MFIITRWGAQNTISNVFEPRTKKNSRMSQKGTFNMCYSLSRTNATMFCLCVQTSQIAAVVSLKLQGRQRMKLQFTGIEITDASAPICILCGPGLLGLGTARSVTHPRKFAITGRLLGSSANNGTICIHWDSVTPCTALRATANTGACLSDACRARHVSAA